MKWPARRMESQAGKSFGIYEEAALLERGGADIIHLELGRPSFDTPEHVKAAARDALDRGVVHYGDLRGNAGLRTALAEKLRSFNDIDITPDEILITNGLTQAAMATFAAGVDPGDEVIVFDPAYPQHLPKVGLLGGTVMPVPLVEEEGWRLDADRLAGAITPRTVMIVLVDPANPVGRVFSRDELQIVADAAVEHDLIVVTDEVYEYITYDGNLHHSIASFDGMRERTISLFAFTKAYAMDGWRLGYVAAPSRFVDQILKVTLNQTTHPNVFAQEGAIAAVRGPMEAVSRMVAEDLRRRDLLCGRLDALPGVSCPRPEGTIYAFPDVRGLGVPSKELARRLLHEAHVAVEAGSFYGEAGEGHLRLCFGSEPYDLMDQACDRMEPILTQLHSTA